MAMWSAVLTAAAIALIPGSGADKTYVSAPCTFSLASDNVYAYAEKELSSGRTLRLSRFADKVFAPNLEKSILLIVF